MATTRYEGNVSSTANELLPLGVRENGRFSTRNCVNPVGLAAGSYLIAEWITDPQDPSGAVQIATDAAGATFIRRSTAYPATWAVWQTTSGGSAGVASWQGAVGAPRTGLVVATAGDYTSSMVTNTSATVPGVTAADADDALRAQILALTSTNVANSSGVVGATVTAALNTLNAALGAITSTQVSNLSTVVGATVTAALNTLNTGLTALTGGNLGAGAQVFSAKVGSVLQFRSIVAGTNATVTQNVNDVSIAASLTSWSITDQKPVNTPGGTSAVGINIRDVNTLVANGPLAANVTVAANRITLAPGRYQIDIKAPAFQVGLHRITLVDNATNADLILGTCAATDVASGTTTLATLSGNLTVAAPLTVRIEHVCGAVVVNVGLGFGTGWLAMNEQYTAVQILQLG